MLAKIPIGFFTDTYNVDTSTKQKQIHDLTDYLSIKDIVQAERDSDFPSRKHAFKVKPISEASQKNCKFLSIRVKPQPYIG